VTTAGKSLATAAHDVAAVERGGPVATRRLRLTRPLDLGLTLRPLVHGSGFARDAIVGRGEAWWATRTPGGPATTRFLAHRDEVLIYAWGPGADAALDSAPAVLGEADDNAGFNPAHPLLRDLHHRMPGLRIPRTGAVAEALVPVIMQQKVIGLEARNGYSRLLRGVSEPAPGPGGLVLPPAAETLAAMPYWAFHPFALERRRAETVMRVARRARWLDASAGMDTATAYARLRSIPGIGAWTTAAVALSALGDADAVLVGDYHIPDLVSWALAGEPRGDDARMLELLEPYRGHRGRVLRLLGASGISAPRYGPRLPLRRLERD
jgi:3-methyladenine DNA glycosylase/8-oxoguanine DNA glycosylase